MWVNQRTVEPSAKIIHPHAAPTPPPKQIQVTPTSHSPSALNKSSKLSRRELAISANSSLLLLLGTQALVPLHQFKARAEEVSETTDVIQPENTPGESEVKAGEVSQGTDITENEAKAEAVSENTDVIKQENDLGENKARTEEVSENTYVTEKGNGVGESQAKADEVSENTNATQPENDSGKNNYCAGQNLTNRAFLEVSIDGEPAGRIVVGLYGNTAPGGTARFSNLVSGRAGISYRRKEFVKIMPTYVQHGGVRSYGVDAELASRRGSNMTVDSLVSEWEKQYESCPGTKNIAGSISIIVRDPSKPPPKVKLVARNGKLEIDQEEVGKAPNGTEFIIATKDSPELDSSALVVGRVLEGMDVVERIGQVKTVKENTSSPYFRVAKLIGDKRAVVAERGFNRPYSKVMITNCGLM
ncbi:peptidyl-prolyl cis-trans isomerase CYP26-2, chloroplastic [Ipomoea triloba]|uniref:peptidyl-prolyl cis-trans isomerase CYP26-2, chloroplastic n=1 Tax=Ipomoea triloba TaxID=35885 RepID=UPI00125E1164|nr:peptidyl-prolyl cis-trans isomerase CYP26-2, chloroplastic [Ipomoea triloba]